MAAQGLALYQSLLWNCPNGWQFIICLSIWWLPLLSPAIPFSFTFIALQWNLCPNSACLTLSPQLALESPTCRTWYQEWSREAFTRGEVPSKQWHGLPLSAATLLSSRWTHEPSNNDGRERGYSRAQRHAFTLTKDSLAACCCLWMSDLPATETSARCGGDRPVTQ